MATTTPALEAHPDRSELRRAGEIVGRIGASYSARVVGQKRLRTSLLVALLCEGHVLLESVPGLAKTLAASTIARAIGADFVRIQCTPDLMPADLIGSQVFDPATGGFTTQLGPVHTHLVLLDEVNRASAKTQAAMLEAMAERQISIGGEVHPLPRPFVVLATQNPIEEEGTYVLPQAQMDRFLLKEVIRPPDRGEELEVLNRFGAGELDRGEDRVEPVGLDDVAYLHDVVSRIYVDPVIRSYIVELVQATREIGAALGPEYAWWVEHGASPRASLAFYQVARALALLAGRDHVIPEDVRHLRHAVLRHRLVLGFEAQAEGVAPETVVDAVFRAVPAP